QFLWQGTVIAVLFACVRAIGGRRLSPQARYALGCLALAAMAGAPVLTLLLGTRLAPAATTSWPLPSPGAWGPVMPWLVAGWFLGAAGFTLRLAGGIRVAARLRSTRVRPAPASAEHVLRDLMV